MPQPTLHDAHVDALLTNVSIGWVQNAMSNLVVPRVFPVVPVDHRSDKYYYYPKDAWFRDEAQIRKAGAESVGSGYPVSTQDYSVDVWAFHKDIDDYLRWNADAAIDLDGDATKFVTQRLMIRLERAWVADFFKTGVWGTDIVGNAAPGAGQTYFWDDYTNSDPVADVDHGHELIQATTGLKGNKMVVGFKVFNRLKNHPDLIDRFKYTSAQTITEDVLARLFGVEEFIVAQGIVNTANEGGTAVFAQIYPNSALLLHTTPSPALMTPTAGYTFMWRGISAGLGQPQVIRRIRIEEKRVDRVEGEIAFANKVVAPELGVFFSNIISA